MPTPSPFSTPHLLFDNRTELDAIHFDTLDQHGQAFHVIVAKQGFALTDADDTGRAQLLALPEAAPLIDADQYLDTPPDETAQPPRGSVRCESDLAPFKPCCDVIVNATAHAPGGRHTTRFSVALRVQNPSRPAPMPERPQGFNPVQGPSAAEMQAWRQACEQAQRSSIPGERLIDKELSITGPRQLIYQAPKKPAPIDDPAHWSLTAPRAFTQLPLRYEHALGGECRVEAGSPHASRVPVSAQLSPAERAQHPDHPQAPLAHQACDTNPLGHGFTRSWYLSALGAPAQDAPRIEYSAAPFSADTFARGARGEPLPQPAGLGPIGRGWLPRRALVGSLDTHKAWHPNEVPCLPPDFDFAYWNCAPTDQQCAHLQGGEHFLLTNLCAPNHPSAQIDAQGQTQLRFTLPKEALFVLLGDTDGAWETERLALDTVSIDPEAQRVDLTWRIALPAGGQGGRLHQAHLHHAQTKAQLDRLRKLEDHASAAPPPST